MKSRAVKSSKVTLVKILSQCVANSPSKSLSCYAQSLGAAILTLQEMSFLPYFVTFFYGMDMMNYFNINLHKQNWSRLNIEMRNKSFFFHLPKQNTKIPNFMIHRKIGLLLSNQKKYGHFF